jgi:UDP-N-acetylglucosamine/UDP-N-acetylgalactosamine diphosphorylase
MITPIPQALAQRLQSFGQEHLLRWWDDLNDEERRILQEQIEAVDFETVADHYNSNRDATEVSEDRERASRAEPPTKLVRLPCSDAERSVWEAAEIRGQEILAAGKVGAILVAGGQGSRLNFHHPKGMFPIGPVSEASLFQIFAEQLLATSRRAGVTIPYYIMTSDSTHEETVQFFESRSHFGLDPQNVFFFRQGNMPAIDIQTGRLLLSEKGQLALSPNGHGGILEALSQAGLLSQMREAGIEYLYYHQVDNPTAIVCDPAFLGLHAKHGSELSTKVVSKRDPSEPMGVVVDVDGQTQIIEYSHLTTEAANAVDDSGSLNMWAGNTAIHLINRALLDRLIADKVELPYRLAAKYVPHLDETGKQTQQSDGARPNAYKFERFIFDVLPLATTSLVVEADRAREFNPVKNATGGDTPETAKAAMLAIDKARLQMAGADIRNGVPIEISPLFALDDEQLKEKIPAGTRFQSKEYLR